MQRARRSPATAGLSLIEAVVALGLLGLLLAALLTVSGSGLGAWLDSREALSGIRREAAWTEQLQASLAAMLPMPLPASAAGGRPSVFFQGEPRALRFVSAHSPAWRGRGGLRLVSLLAVQQGREFSLRLADAPCPDAESLMRIRDAPIPWRQPAGSPRLLPHPRARAVAAVVAEGVAECEFRYLQLPARAGEGSRWVSRWSNPATLPRAVRVAWSLGRQSETAAGMPERAVVITAGSMAQPAHAGLVSATRQGGRKARASD